MPNINKVVYYGNTLIDLSQDTIAQGDVLSGKTVHLPSGQQVQGSMVNNGSTSATITTKAQQVTIPSGYTSGGTVQIDSTEQGKIIAGNIKKDVTVLGVTGTYEGATASSTTATVTPSVNSQIILPSTYSVDYFDEVDVNAIPYAETDNVAGGKTADIGDNATPINKLALDVSGGSFSIDASDLAGITQIRLYAFQSCTGLTSITIPDSVTSIGSNAFASCSSLTSVIIPDSVTSIGSFAFYGCTRLTSVSILAGITNIYASTFYGCSSLTSITIPDNVTSIGNNAFNNCTGLTSITSLNTTPPTITSNTFSNVSVSIPVYVPSSSVLTYQSAQYWSNFTNIQAIPS